MGDFKSASNPAPPANSQIILAVWVSPSSLKCPECIEPPWERLNENVKVKVNNNYEGKKGGGSHLIVDRRSSKYNLVHFPKQDNSFIKSNSCASERAAVWEEGSKGSLHK